MNNPPAFRFYPADWLADAKVQAMSLEAEGIYIRLLCYCWREGSIPADRQAIAKLCKGYNGPAIDEAISCFVSMKKNGKKSDRLINKRLEVERKKQIEFRQSMKKAGIDGANKRWGRHSQAMSTGNSQAKERPMAKNSSSLSLSSSLSSKEEDLRKSSNIVKIVSYLNEKTGKKFKADSAETKKFINGRLAEGHTVEDFKRVIDIKVEKWRDDPKMSDYLRPSTLFRPGNFEAYLNELKPEEREKNRDKEFFDMVAKEKEGEGHE
jgi:uncharacterized phage protein (TIGR02220 family)